jgi:hypothetical protein
MHGKGNIIRSTVCMHVWQKQYRTMGLIKSKSASILHLDMHTKEEEKKKEEWTGIFIFHPSCQFFSKIITKSCHVCSKVG